jgi:hypothetical protein
MEVLALAAWPQVLSGRRWFQDSLGNMATKLTTPSFSYSGLPSQIPYM